MSFKQTVHVLFVSSNQDSAIALLNSTLPGLKTSDNQEWTTTEGEFTVNGYIKFPGKDVHRKSANNLDILVFSVPEGDPSERDIINYSSNRRDCYHRLFVDASSRSVEEHICSVSADGVKGKLTDYIEILKVFNTGTPDDEPHYYQARLELNVNRQEQEPKYKTKFNVNRDVLKELAIVDKVLVESSTIDLSKYVSSNSMKFDFSPENTTSNGIGVLLELNVGEQFSKENPELPLIVRDNHVTITLELHAKDESGVKDIISTLEMLREMLYSMFLEKFEKKLGPNISFSSDKTNVYLDVTFGGLFGESIINKVRSFNLENFGLSMKDTLRFQTNVNCKDLYEDPNVDNIISKLSTVTLTGEGKLINLRTLLVVLQQLSKVISNDKDKKSVILVTYLLMILTTFEQVGLEMKYNTEDLKSSGMEVADAMLGGEGASKAMIGQGDEMVVGTFLPMLFGSIEMIKPMLEPFANGLKQVDLDKICFEVLIPALRIELKKTILLPGITEFMEKKILN